jgi:hypothetical protein
MCASAQCVQVAYGVARTGSLEGDAMAGPSKVLYYSIATEDFPVHHNNPTCRIGIQILIKDVRLGDDGRPLCDECIRLELSELHEPEA